MLGGKGFFRGSSILASGHAGTGKSSLAAHFAAASCSRGERCLYVAFEESPSQILRNMQSIGINLETWVDKDLLRFHATRPTGSGLEMHLVTVIKMVQDFCPDVVILDPLTSFLSMGDEGQVGFMLMCMIDFIKGRQITAFITSLVHSSGAPEESGAVVSSLIDTWLLLRNTEDNGERNRALFILKSRGMSHSNESREFVLTDKGIRILDVVRKSDGKVLTGSARGARGQVDHKSSAGRKRKSRS